MTRVRIRVLAFTDPHGSIRAAESIIALAREAMPYAIVCAGDISIFGSGHEEFLNRLAVDLGDDVYYVPGNHDISISHKINAAWDFMHELTYKALELPQVTLMGLPGSGHYWPSKRAATEDCETPISLFSERSTDRPSVLVTHFPPSHLRAVDGSGSDSTDAGGSGNVRRIVATTRPDLVICGHYHSCFGARAKMLGVQVVNPGPSGCIYEL